MAGKKSRLSELHRQFTEALIKELDDADKGKYPLAAADKSVIVKFLKDNDITADVDDEAMSELKDAFHDDLAKRRAARAKILQDTVDDGTDPLQGVI